MAQGRVSAGKRSAEEEAAQAATQPKVQKVEPPDLLAGLRLPGKQRG